MPKVRKRNDNNSRLKKRKNSVKADNDYKKIQYQALESKSVYSIRTALIDKEASGIYKKYSNNDRRYVRTARKKERKAKFKRKFENKHVADTIFTLYKGLGNNHAANEDSNVENQDLDIVDPTSYVKNIADGIYTATIVADKTVSVLEFVDKLPTEIAKLKNSLTKETPNRPFPKIALKRNVPKFSIHKQNTVRSIPKVHVRENKHGSENSSQNININIPESQAQKFKIDTRHKSYGSSHSAKGAAILKNSALLLKTKTKETVTNLVRELPNNLSNNVEDHANKPYSLISKGINEEKAIAPAINTVKAIGSLILTPKKHGKVMLGIAGGSVPDEFGDILKAPTNVLKTGKTTVKATAKAGKVAYKGAKVTAKLTAKLAQVVTKAVVALVKAIAGLVTTFFVPIAIGVVLIGLVYSIFSIFAATPNSTEDNLIEHARLVRQLDAEVNARINAEIYLADDVIYLRNDNTRLHTNIPTFFALFAVKHDQEWYNKEYEVRALHSETYTLHFEHEAFTGMIEVEVMDDYGETQLILQEVEKVRVIINLVIYSFDEMFEILEFTNDQISQARARREMPLFSIFPNLGFAVNFGGVNNLSHEELERILNSLPHIEGSRRDVVEVAMSFLTYNVVYQWGGKGHGTDLINRPTGLDCSGFTGWVFRFANVTDELFGTGTAFQWDRSFAIREDELLPGDLGFLKMPSQVTSSAPNHVGIYLGTDTQGRHLWIHCASGTRANPQGGVIVDNFNFVHFRRVMVRWDD